MNNPWLAEDPELLHETLALIDAWGDGAALDRALADAATDASNSELDESAKLDLSDPLLDDVDDVDAAARAKKMVVRASAAGGRVASRARAKPTAKSSTSLRRRNEIQDLRDLIEALQARVAAMKLGGRAKGYDASLPLASLWQSVAENQLRLRREGELEQATLRRLLESHSAIAQGMAVLMRQSQAMRAEEASRALQRDVTLDRLRLLPHSVEQFESIDLIYANLPTVFSHSAFHGGTDPFIEFEIVSDLEGEIVLSFREAWAVPFGTKAVLDALWIYTLQQYEKKWGNTGPQVLVDTYEAFVAHFFVRAAFQSFVYSFFGQLVVRRFPGTSPGQETAAIVTSTHTPPNLSEDPQALRVTMQENSCLRVTTSVGPDGCSPSSLVQTNCHVSFKYDYADAATGRFFAGLFVQFMLASLKADTDVKRSTIEALLLQTYPPL